MRQFASTDVLTPMKHTDELYISHYNKDFGGDQGLFDKHYTATCAFAVRLCRPRARSTRSPTPPTRSSSTTASSPRRSRPTSSACWTSTASSTGLKGNPSGRVATNPPEVQLSDRAPQFPLVGQAVEAANTGCSTSSRRRWSTRKALKPFAIRGGLSLQSVSPDEQRSPVRPARVPAPAADRCGNSFYKPAPVAGNRTMRRVVDRHAAVRRQRECFRSKGFKEGVKWPKRRHGNRRPSAVRQVRRIALGGSGTLGSGKPLTRYGGTSPARYAQASSIQQGLCRGPVGHHGPHECLPLAPFAMGYQNLTSV